MDLTPVQVKESLTRDQFRLYQLIWKRICGKPYALSKIRYDFSSYYGRKTSICKFRFQTCVSGLFVVPADDDKEEPNAVLAKVTKDSMLSLSELLPEQHFYAFAGAFYRGFFSKKL